MLKKKHESISIKSISMLGFCSMLLIIATRVTKGDTISTTQSLRDGESLVSAGGSFELGFFSPGILPKRYLGIWYNDITDKTVVWVANREIPLTDTSGVLSITNQGVLTLHEGNGTLVWSSNSSKLVSDPIAQLLDSGNLLVKDEVGIIWQSFDYPTDTLLPGMKLGWNLETGHEWFLSSWKAVDDPSNGNFTYRIDHRGYPEMVVMENSIVKFRSGPWNGQSFSGLTQLKLNPVYSFGLVINDKEMHYSFDMKNPSIKSRLLMEPSGKVQRFTCTKNIGWQLYLSLQIDDCDTYARCGAYSSCNINNSHVCSCLEMFVPKIPKEWDMMDWSSGCVRERVLNCSSDGFVVFERCPKAIALDDY